MARSRTWIAAFSSTVISDKGVNSSSQHQQKADREQGKMTSRESPDDDDVMIIDDDDYMDAHFENSKDEKEKISSGNKCSNPLHSKWGNNDNKLKMASKLSNSVITIFRHLGYERSSGCMFCETCINKASEVAEMDKSQGTSAITVSDDSNDKSDSRSSSMSRTRLTRKQSEQAQIQAQLDRLAVLDIDEEEKASRAKQLRMLAFVNPGKFMEDFDPETSAREMKKINRRVQKEKITRKNQLYDDSGVLLCNKKDLCDCLDVECPGCHFPCPRCRSEKCGGDCRCNRRWVYDHIEIEGTDINLSWNFQVKPAEGQ